ncbi:MAG: hypothetical protein ACQESE_02785 [Nanobdellota archaeon]
MKYVALLAISLIIVGTIVGTTAVFAGDHTSDSGDETNTTSYGTSSIENEDDTCPCNWYPSCCRYDSGESE